MIERGIPNGKLVMISSTLGLMGILGYSQYGPAKHALRGKEEGNAPSSSLNVGLADILRQELSPYNIDVHVYFVSTIMSPGYEKEACPNPFCR